MAAHLLSVLGVRKGKLVNSNRLAWSLNTNPVVVRKLTALLKNAGLITASRGATGGFQLAKEASQISLYDVYSAVEKPEIFHMHYSEINMKCPVARNIQPAMGESLQEAYDGIAKALSKKSISDIKTTIFTNDKKRSKK